MERRPTYLIISVAIILTSFQVVHLLQILNQKTLLLTGKMKKTNKIIETMDKRVMVLDEMKSNLTKTANILEEVDYLVKKIKHDLKDVNSHTQEINQHIYNITLSTNSLSETAQKLEQELHGLSRTTSGMNQENIQFLNKLSALYNISEKVSASTSEISEQLNRKTIKNLISSFLKLEKKR